MPRKINKISYNVFDKYFYNVGCREIKGEKTMNAKAILPLVAIILVVVIGNWNRASLGNPSISGRAPESMPKIHSISRAPVKAIFFVTPDCSYKALEYLIGIANTSIHIMIYEMWSEDVANLLVNASQRGVEVKIVFEGSTYSTSGTEYNKNMSAMLISYSNGLIGPNDLRFENINSYLHAKVVIVDNKVVMITSENIFPTSFPKDPTQIELRPYTTASRGWGVILFDSITAQKLEEIFSEIFYNHATIFDTSDNGTMPTSNGLLNYQPEFDTFTIYITGSKLVTTLGYNNSVTSNDEISQLIGSARHMILMEQMYIYNSSQVIQDLINDLASAHNSNVTIQLIMEDNIMDNYDDVAKYLNSLGVHTIPAFNYSYGFLFLHNKGMIVDNDRVLIGSINWSGTAMLSNTEVGVIINSTEANMYFREIFRFDWEKSSGEKFDSDDDGLSDIYEQEHNTNPNSKDTDQDGLGDFEEIFIYHTDPTVSQEVVVRIKTPPDNQYINTTRVHFNWSLINKEYVSNVSILINNSVYATVSNESVILELNDQAYYQIMIVPNPVIPVKTASASVGIYIDTIPPNIYLPSDLNGTTITNNTASIRINVSDYALSVLKIRRNGTMVLQKSLSGKMEVLNLNLSLNLGLNIFDIIVGDKAGNERIVRLALHYEQQNISQNENQQQAGNEQQSTEASDNIEIVILFHRYFGMFIISMLILIAVVAVRKRT